MKRISKIMTAILLQASLTATIANAENYRLESFVSYLSAAYTDQDNNVVEIYNKGYDAYIKGDYKEAAKLYHKAAEKGYVHAQCNLGTCYYLGNGVEKNYTEAAKWYRKAAEQEHAGAQYNLGVCYLQGDGVEQNITESIKWLRKAEEQGDTDAKELLKAIEQKNQQCSTSSTKEPTTAKEMLMKGVEAYEKENYVEAVKWFRKAAEKGDADAQFLLGMCYLNGKGVEQDIIDAGGWLGKAANQGHKKAKELLNEFVGGECAFQSFNLPAHLPLMMKKITLSYSSFSSFPAFTSPKVGLKALSITSHASASFRPSMTFANPL